MTMPGPWMADDELPRFVSLLRMAHGPIDRDSEHHGERMALEELEDLGDDFFNADTKARCILTCRQCGLIAWAWFDE